MPQTSSEHRYTNPHSETADIPFHQWLADDPHFYGLNRPDIRHMQRVIRLLDIPNVFAETESEYLTHNHKLALIIRYAADIYSPEEIFNLFGVNRKTIATYTMITSEPKGRTFYSALHNALDELKRRRIERKQKKLITRIDGRRSNLVDIESLAEEEFAEVIAR